MATRQPRRKGKGGAMSKRNDFIEQMEASGKSPTWETIYEINATVASLRAKLAEAERQRDQWKFLYDELAATQLRDRQRLTVAREALAQVLDCVGVRAARLIARMALIAITNDGEEQ